MISRLLNILILFCPLWPVTGQAVEFSNAEKALIASFGPWPPAQVIDSSNRFSGNPQAIRFGEALFFDHGLGGDSKLSCASCHDPGRAFTDGRKLGEGRAKLTRNTSSLLNLAGNRWFGWGGENDSLWSQSIRPILDANEMAGTATSTAALVRGSPRYRNAYRKLVADPDKQADEVILVDVAKALAAYQETLVSPRTAFDDFRDAITANDTEGMMAYAESAQRGLKLFIGKGRCFFCHTGPAFSNREFADIGISYFIPGGVDRGRYSGIQQAKNNRFNRLGSYNDGSPETNATSIRGVHLQHRNFGEFKVPGLRSLVDTAPYMHNGSLPDLHTVVNHYSALDEERLHSDGEKILRPLNLSDNEIADLVSFLISLSP